MIIIIGAIPCAGKSTLVREIIKELGSAEDVEPFPLFKSQKHGDILVVGRYPENETFGGTDRLSYKTIKLFREFIDRQQPKYKHIIVEGDRFFRSVDLEWIVENHDTKVFVLTVDSDEEKRRHVERNDTQSEVWLSGRRSQISNILTNFNLMGKIEVRQNNSFESSQKIRGEIMEILNGEQIHGKV